MSITTKKGDTSYTSLVTGERVSKYHSIIETMGTIDEANSFLGLARASAKDNQVKQIILQIQNHLYIIGAEVFNPKKEDTRVKVTISEIEVNWLDRLVEKYEKALSIPPGFVTFGREETSSNMDVARTIVRKVERMVVKMKSEGMIGNDCILKYLNRLSDLIFLLACLEEKREKERREIKGTHFPFQLVNLFSQKWAIFTGSTILSLIAAIIYCSTIHCKHMI